MNGVFDTTGADLGTPPGITRWQITTPSGAPPARVFRRVVPLRLQTGGGVGRVVFDNAALQGSFKRRDYNIAPGGPHAFEPLAGSAGMVKVTLDMPRHVREVRLSSALAGAASVLELYRLDGNTPAPKATASAMLAGRPPVASLPANEDFTDVRFALKLRDSGALAPSGIVHLGLRSYPTTPRLGLAPLAADGLDLQEEPLFFWQAPGEIGTTAPASDGNFDAGPGLKQELERYLATLDRPLPLTIALALVLESDAPCAVEVAGLGVTYRLSTEAFPSGEAKQVLRFGNGQGTAHDLRVSLPGNASVSRATLRVAESFRLDRVAGSDVAPAPIAGHKLGIHVGAERWVAQGVMPAAALSATGISLGLLGLTDATELMVELQEDWDGEPSGRKLATGMVAIQRAGRRGWFTLLFPEAIVLTTQPHWLLLRASSGSAVWLAQPGTPGVRVLHEGGAIRPAWQGFGDVGALFQLLSRSSVTEMVGPATLTIGSQLVPSTLGGTGRIFDLAPALNAYLAALSANGAANIDVPLTFTSQAPGIMTVYPPLIEFDT